MIFTPQIYDIFLSRQREWLANKLLKGKEQVRYLKMLKSVTLKQALSRDVFSYRTDIAKYTDKIFGACVLCFLKNNCYLSTSFSGKGTFYTDIKVYELLIFELLYSGFKMGYCKIDFAFADNAVTLTAFPAVLSDTAVKLTQKLRGCIIYEKNTVWVKIPSLKRTENNASVISETDRLNDPFAPINYYFL